MITRDATRADLPAINEIYNESVANSVATFDTEPKALTEREAWFAGRGARHPVLVAEKEGRILGWASLNPYSDRRAYDTTVENSVYIDPTARGGGVGRALMAELIRRARASGVHAVLARISDGNAASVALHAKLGFETVGNMREVGHKFGRFIDVLIMQLIIR